MQWAADGDIAIISHSGQKKTLRDHEGKETAQLCSTSMERDGVVLHHKVHHHLRCDGGGVTEVNKGQVTEEEVHGCVESRINPDYNNQPKVA